jgi:lipopolysaccharide transport system ATP-binding protein
MNVIEVKGLIKKYRIGRVEKKSDTLMGALMEGIKSPLRNLRQIQGLTRLEDEGDSINWALRDVSFEVKEGEVLGIIGHNGAGKSTLLKILSRITEPSEGEVHIHGRVAALLEVGTGFHPELTGRENIYMNGTILGMRKKEIDHKLDEIVDFSGVEKYLDTPVKFYSSGMRVRLGFSVAAHLEPEILIIDEVLAVGDAEFQKKCLGKMGDVASQGRTVLFVSHDLMAVKNLCYRALLLKNGSIVAAGDTSHVIETYRNNFSDDSRKGFFLFDDTQKRIKSDFFRTISLRVEGEHSSRIAIGDSIKFEIEFEKKIGISLNADVAIVIKDQNLIPVVTFNTVFQKRSVLLAETKGKITCIVNDILLTPGRYYIYLWVALNNRAAEIMENAGSLEIISSDIFKSGVTPNQKHHGFLIHQDYQFKV